MRISSTGTYRLWTCPNADISVDDSTDTCSCWLCLLRSSCCEGIGSWPLSSEIAGRSPCSPHKWSLHSGRHCSCPRKLYTVWSQFALQHTENTPYRHLHNYTKCFITTRQQSGTTAVQVSVTNVCRLFSDTTLYMQHKWRYLFCTREIYGEPWNVHKISWLNYHKTKYITQLVGFALLLIGSTTIPSTENCKHQQ